MVKDVKDMSRKELDEFAETKGVELDGRETKKNMLEDYFQGFFKKDKKRDVWDLKVYLGKDLLTAKNKASDWKSRGLVHYNEARGSIGLKEDE